MDGNAIMKKMPARRYASQIKNSQDSAWVTDEDGNTKWVPARPLPYYYNPIKSFIKRFGMAFDVFRGKADALYWDGQ